MAGLNIPDDQGPCAATVYTYGHPEPCGDPADTEWVHYNREDSRAYDHEYLPSTGWRWVPVEGDKPQVYVSVLGGVAYVFVEPKGSIELVEQDWDNLNDGGLLDYELADLFAMRARLQGVRDARVRGEALESIDEKIKEWQEVTNEGKG